MEISDEDFAQVVADAIDAIPAEAAAKLINVAFVIEPDGPEWDPTLLGLYDGVPLTERDNFWAAGGLPDKITIFRSPTLRICNTVEDVREEVHITVMHEVGHYFGISDERLHELGWA